MENRFRQIVLKKVAVHNLKGVDLTLEPQRLVVFTGVSGSGKSSMAFDTIYAEGQRRYVESLSTFARRQLGEMEKPLLEHASGITPTIAIEQKTAGKNPRSTVGTLTEIYDYLRVLYARIGVAYCPVSKEQVMPQSRERIVKKIQSYPEGKKIMIFTPYAKGKKGEFKEDFQELLKRGFTRVRVDGEIRGLEDEISLDGSVSHDIDIVVDRLVVSPENQSRIAESAISALALSEGLCSVLNVETDAEELFSMHAYSPKSGLSYRALEPQDFSFNSPSGMCARCLGLGVSSEFDLDLIIDPNLSIAEDCCRIASSYSTVRYGNIYDNLADLYGFNVHTPWKQLPETAKKIFLYGTEKKWTRMHFVHPITGAAWIDNVMWRGVLHEAKARYAEAKTDAYRKKIDKLMRSGVCPECEGERLKPYPRHVLVGGKRIGELSALTITEMKAFFEKLALFKEDALIANDLVKEISGRLKFLKEVGLHYLALDRTAPTLSGGEAQRVRLASQIGCGLVGITYILDEPSIGLHPRDNLKLIQTLKHLRDIGNSVIVVEHDEETILEADHIVDFGPGAGLRGGEIVFSGDLDALLKCKNSITADYLTGRKEIAIPKKRRKPGKEYIEIKGASHHNLKNVHLKLPLGLFVGITGVSGSGKSSLISETLYPALANALHKSDSKVGKYKEGKGFELVDKVIEIDQAPIGRNPRSNPATYIKLFDDIRDLFAELPESKARGYLPGRFSFNVKEGSCSECEGMGQVRIDMDFMEDIFASCTLCQGKRFDHETLSVYYKGKNIYDVLEMEVGEALEFFANIPHIRKKLEMLKKVGLDYLKIGQSSTTLSGGEAQRVKLAKELVRPATGKTLYILDEPTTGLHFHDIKHLLDVLHHLVEMGNSVVVIEHSMDVIKTVDWVIDIGPEGGGEGGEIVAAGSPEKIAKLKTPTGAALHQILHKGFSRITEAKKTEKKQEVKKTAVEEITVEDAEQNNLKAISVKIPREKITVCTGPSGSGKTSLAFDTIYAEGQRRYIESLSPYARQFVKQMPKPKVGRVEGLSPAVAIEQKAHAGNPRSTIGTMTEIYDYLRVLYARLGEAHCPETGEKIKAISKEHVVQTIMQYPEGEKIQILAPIDLKKAESFEECISRLKRQGYVRIRLNGDYFDLDADAETIFFDKKRKNELFLVVDRLKTGPNVFSRLFEAVETAAQIGEKKLTVAKEKKDVFFNLSFAVESTGKSYPEITPHTFSFNSQEGMCLECQGLGVQYGANLMNRPEIQDQSAAGLIRFLWGEKSSQDALKYAFAFCKQQGIEIFKPLAELPAKKLHLLMNGSIEDQWIEAESGLCLKWLGINEALAKAGKHARSDLKESLKPLLDEQECPACKGARINPLARHVTLQTLAIQDVSALSIDKALDFIRSIKMSKTEEKLLEEVYRQIETRLSFLKDVGLGYLALERKAPTLSGGESQRIRLARQLGSGLTGVMYVLDEPTIGLHPRDNARLAGVLQKLKALGNTLILVEHDPLTVLEADYLLDFGPEAGSHGGHIIAKGTISKILQDPKSLTGRYLSGDLKIPIPKKRRSLTQGSLKVLKANAHNLKNLSVEIPLGAITCLTGVSGSGKSTLMHDVIFPLVKKGLLKNDKEQADVGAVEGINHFDRLLYIDQNPIGHTVRSDVCTYVDVLSRIREFFASLPEAQIRGLQPKHFSYNHRKGMCTGCWGLGYKKVEMFFLPSVKVTCEDCKGLRLNPLTLEVSYGGKNMGQYLDTTVEEARKAFANHPRIVRILDTLISVGLGYLKLGQEMATLSGGEAQRIKLSRELSKRSSGKTLYLLDEPTTGLHSEDIKKLLGVLNRLVDKGSTMVIIEHNLDMIANADYIIDLGPESGKDGGRLVASGTPEEVAKHKSSFTARYLKLYLAH